MIRGLSGEPQIGEFVGILKDGRGFAISD